MNLAAELSEIAGQPAQEFMPPATVDYGDRLALVKRGMERFQAEALALRDAVQGLTIKDIGGSARAAELKAEAQKITKRIDAKVKELCTTDDVQAVLDYIQAVKNFGANLKAPLSEAKVEADRKLSIWAEYERQERAKQAKAAAEAIAKAQAKIDKEAEKKGIEPVKLPEVVAPVQKTVIRTDSGSTFEVRRWKCNVMDAEKVPREYCSPDHRKIKDAIDGGIREISGVEIFEEVTMQTRTR